MTSNKSVLDVKILGKDYKIGCERELERSLLQASQYLDYKMREIRDKHHVVGLDKIAVLAALHITHEFLNSNSLQKHQEQSIEFKLNKLSEKINETLS